MTVRLSDLRRNLAKSYDKGAAERSTVPVSKIDWSDPYQEYAPTSYTLPTILSGSVPWADPDVSAPDFKPNWNGVDEVTKVDRRSHSGIYEVVAHFGPLNPSGRTGLRGRGRLGRWGPNHACDPIVTRWKQADEERVTDFEGLPFLQFIAIQRKDTLEWAIPGGMIEPGEDHSDALLREFMEEVFSSEDSSEEDQDALREFLDGFFQNGEDIYKGYVDDPRNTDNAWMETHAVHFHLPDDCEFSNIPLKAGSDALNAKWIDVDSFVSLYASHKNFIESIATKMDAHW